MPVEAFQFGPFRLELKERRLVRGPDTIAVSPKSFEVLTLLVLRAGRLVTRETLLHEVWRETYVEEANITYTISVLRKALGDDPETPEYIETVPKQGYRFIAAVRPIAEPGDVPHQSPPRRAKWIALLAAATLVPLAAGFSYAVKNRRITWAYGTALPALERMRDRQEFDDGFRLSRELERVIPDDRRYQLLSSQVAWVADVDSEPAGADVFARGYRSEREWLFLGRTPLRRARFPTGLVRFRLQKIGFDTLLAAVPAWPPLNQVKFILTAQGRAPTGMVLVPRGEVTVNTRRVALEDFWIDRYEVTNAEYATFVRAGGYARPEFWEDPFVKAGVEVAWREAMASFKDSTGQPGPATWLAGTYPQGQGEYPVGGVSWYEARAFANFAGKSLPTLYHWHRASGAGIAFAEEIVLTSNFRAKGPTPVGRGGLSTFGAFDMAGNVREWSLTASGADTKYLMGGGWGDPPYVPLAHPDGSSPFDRAPNNGFRCAKYVAPIAEALWSPLPWVRDAIVGRPVDDRAFEGYRELFAYDRTPLQARIEATNDEAEDWTDQTVTYDGPFATTRLVAHVLVPKRSRGRHQVVFYYPGAHANRSPWEHPLTKLRIEFLLRNGRAVVYPIYLGMHGRVAPRRAPMGPLGYRDRVVLWQRELSRAVDYAETRSDLDTSRAAFFGLSVGAILGPVFTALEPRFKASVLLSGGLYTGMPNEFDVVSFIPRVKVPTLVLHGRYDPIRPADPHARVVFELLRLPASQKRLALADAGHSLPMNFVMAEALAFLDQHLGPVQAAMAPTDDR